MNAIEKHAGSALAITDEQDFFTDKQLAALRQLGVEDASNADLAVFFHHAQRTGLDPFARQIYMVGRWSKNGTKQTIQTGIDGFRLVGRRAADARGETLEITDTEWCGQDGVWRDVWLSNEAPAAARVAIIRNGGRFPAVALFREYAQTKRDGNLTQMWAEKGALMIAKCAEALAWRKAFPQDLSGLYTADEMAMANSRDHHEVAQTEPTVPASPVALADLVDETEEAERDWAAEIEAADLDGLRGLWREAPDEHHAAITARVADLKAGAPRPITPEATTKD